ncbi:hypothetical protein EVAR_25735_1 [Eumeta japonica]|uniref:Uncharacterized protein n=1 Tax=Eumeta variegata TaxID=151549 RepID=A0A4C1V7B5_EUMVA|nr:hypothetical protein EVAR_25735_1 [Eumeta japonica]
MRTNPQLRYSERLEARIKLFHLKLETHWSIHLRSESHQRVDVHRRPWTSATPKKSSFSPYERGGEGGEKAIMGRPCARAHGCVRLAWTKNLLNNLDLHWRKQNAMKPSSQTRPFGIKMPSARDCPTGAFQASTSA